MLQGTKQAEASYSILYRKCYKARNKQKYRSVYSVEKRYKGRNKQNHRVVYFIEKRYKETEKKINRERNKQEASCTVLYRQKIQGKKQTEAL